MKELTRKPYPSDVSDEEWAFAAPYLTLMNEEAPQREHDLREVHNALRWVVRTGSPWRYIPNDLPPWSAVYQQTHRWIAAGVFEAMVHDLRMILRLDAKREPDPTAVVLDSRTLRSTVESGTRAGYDGHKRKKGSKIHAAVDTLGHLLALHATPSGFPLIVAGGTGWLAPQDVPYLVTSVGLRTRGRVQLALDLDHTWFRVPYDVVVREHTHNGESGPVLSSERYHNWRAGLGVRLGAEFPLR